MNIAVMLQGLPDMWERCAPGFLDALKTPHLNSVDFYLSAWVEDDPSPAMGITSELTADLRATYAPLRFHRERFDKFAAGAMPRIERFFQAIQPISHNRDYIERLFWQHYQIATCWNLIEWPEAYDLIIKARYDIEHRGPLPWPQIERMFRAGEFEGALLHNTRGVWGFEPYTMNDWFIVGRPEEMSRFCSWYHQAETTIPLAKEHYTTSAEYYLSWFCQAVHGLRFLTLPMDFSVVRDKPKERDIPHPEPK